MPVVRRPSRSSGCMLDPLTDTVKVAVQMMVPIGRFKLVNDRPPTMDAPKDSGERVGLYDVIIDLSIFTTPGN